MAQDQAPKKPTGAAAHKAPHRKGGGKSRRPGKADPKGQKTGRPPALTPRVHRAIIDNIELLGMPETTAAQAEGFDPSLVGKWKARGAEALAKWDSLTPAEQAEELRYVDFFKAIRDSGPKFEKANLTVIAKAAAEGDWRAAKSRLEHKMPEKYGRRFLLGNDPRNPLPRPTNPVLGAVLILPDNGRGDNPKPEQAPGQAAPPSPASAGGA